MLHGTMLRYHFPDRLMNEGWGHRNLLNLTLQQYAEGEVERKKHMFKKAEEEDKHIFILSYKLNGEDIDNNVAANVLVSWSF